MDEVAPLVGDVLMEQAVFPDGLPVVFGAGFHPLQPSLELDQLFPGLLQPAGRIGPVAAVRHVEMAHGVFQAQRGLGDGGFRLRRFLLVLVENGAVKFSAPGFLHRHPPEPPPRLGAAGEFGLDDPGLGHADAVPGGVDGGAGLEHVVTGGEGIPIRLFLFEVGAAEVSGVLEKYPERLGKSVIFLGEGLIVHLFQKGRVLFVLGGGGDEVPIRLQVEPLLVRQHMVPDIAAAAEGVLEQLRLGLRGVEPDLEGGVLNRFPFPGPLFRCSRHPGPPPSAMFRSCDLRP